LRSFNPNDHGDVAILRRQIVDDLAADQNIA
jgi:hypothetical protein